jgi:hypothetical protein
MLSVESQPTQLDTCFHAGILFGLFDPEDEGDVPPKRLLTFTDYMALYPRK